MAAHHRQEAYEDALHRVKMDELALSQQQEADKAAQALEKSQAIEAARQQEEDIKQQTLKEALKREANQTSAQKAQWKSDQALRDIEEKKGQREEREKRSASRRNRVLGWLQVFLVVLLIIALLLASALGLYRLYRWSTEAPLIKEIEKRVEVETIVEKEIPVEKIVEKVVEKEVPVEKIVEKEVIPDECTQIRRNGKIYVSCDGVKIDGAPTIGDSGVIAVPDLVTGDPQGN